METKRLIFLPLLFVICSVSAQVIPFSQTRTGFIRAQGNLAGGYLFAQKNYSAYVMGDMDVYLSERVSVTGEAWYSFATSDGALRHNHSIFTGFNCHLTGKGVWDPYIGLSPGLGLVAVRYENEGNRLISPIIPVPLVGITAGCNWYLGSIFHLFIKVRWVNGQMMGNAPFRTPLHELKITGGLGWNIRAWTPKARSIPKSG
jgi:hypothetical protein